MLCAVTRACTCQHAVAVDTVAIWIVRDTVARGSGQPSRHSGRKERRRSRRRSRRCGSWIGSWGGCESWCASRVGRGCGGWCSRRCRCRGGRRGVRWRRSGSACRRRGREAGALRRAVSRANNTQKSRAQSTEVAAISSLQLLGALWNVGNAVALQCRGRSGRSRRRSRRSRRRSCRRCRRRCR
jgi:hypothetical protein